MNTESPAPGGDEHEALIQFLYLAPVGLVQCAMDGVITLINPKAAQLLMPLSVDGSLDNLFDVLVHVAPRLRSLAGSIPQPSGVVCESLRLVIAARKDVRADAQVLSLSVAKLGDDRLMAVLTDVTLEDRREQMALERRLLDASRVDALTELPNRVALLEFLQQRLDARATCADGGFAVLFINVDRFSHINNALGRATGDEMLRLVAGRLRSSLRNHDRVARHVRDDQMAVRLGGDEFAVFLASLPHADDAQAVTQRLVDMLAKPYGIGKLQLHGPASIGLVLGQQARDDAGDVLQDASIAMARAKRAGGGHYVVFETVMREEAALRGQLEAELRGALERNELFVAYQPVMALLADGAAPLVCSGVEALVRWRHPRRGVVPPVQFITVAEECDLIVPLGDFVLSEACRQFAQWQDCLGPMAPSRMAVNLSRAQLLKPGFVDRVRQVLSDNHMQASQLQLEITESLAAQDGAIQARLHELKGLGLSLALDDFGTGYSSLSSLHQLPVDTVKIDRSFVVGADTSEHRRVLIDATVRVARSLRMHTVAEGVETAAQAALLRELGCDKLQGYLFSRPLEADAMEPWLRGPGRTLSA